MNVRNVRAKDLRVGMDTEFGVIRHIKPYSTKVLLETALFQFDLLNSKNVVVYEKKVN
jgi:hypothetical protein